MMFATLFRKFLVVLAVLSASALLGQSAEADGFRGSGFRNNGFRTNGFYNRGFVNNGFGYGVGSNFYVISRFRQR